LYGKGFHCEKVSIIHVDANNKKYKFLRLDGNNGDKRSSFDFPKQDISMVYLITNNRFLRRIKVTESQKKLFKFLSKKSHSRFGTKKHSIFNIEHKYFHRDPSTCISLELNHSTKEGDLWNVAALPFCNIANMREAMVLVDAVLKKMKWKGKVRRGDTAMMNGVRVAFHYMRKHKDTLDKFSKYEDYGFMIRPESIPKLREIKKNVLTMSDEEAMEKYDDEIADLLSEMYLEYR
jgi:hypothetical protein